MVTVCLLTDAWFPLVDLPRLVPIPNSPRPIRHMKSLLEALPEAPLHRPIVHRKLRMRGEDTQILNGKDSLALLRSFYL